jgi:hypothetical protein
MIDDLAELCRGIHKPAATWRVRAAKLYRCQRLDVFIRKRVDEDAVGYAEDRRSGADAEGQREDRGDPEGGCAWSLPEARSGNENATPNLGRDGD